MPEQTSRSPVELSPLPQYGFASELDFDKLVENNPFLYRVYTPKKRSSFKDASEPYFVGPRHDEQFSSLSPTTRKAGGKFDRSYADVARHMDWTTRSTSPYISTSFSFIWATWEAARRYHSQMKHDVEIAVIDARALVGRAVTAVELLRLSEENQRDSKYWKWYRFALEAQDVLVHESIPRSAVLASIPLVRILEQLPSFFLRQSLENDVKIKPMDRLAWDVKEVRPSFRLFCQDMSSRFFGMPLEHRQKDSSTGAVQLATTLLQPWFDQMVLDDFGLATSKACELSEVIAKWPGGPWWSRDNLEILRMIRDMVSEMAEDLREKVKGESQEEVSQQQVELKGLETSLKAIDEQVCSHLDINSPTRSSPAVEISLDVLSRTILQPQPRSPITLVDAPEKKIMGTGLLTPPSSPPPPRRRPRTLSNRRTTVRFDTPVLPATPEMDEFEIEPKFINEETKVEEEIVEEVKPVTVEVAPPSEEITVQQEEEKSVVELGPAFELQEPEPRVEDSVLDRVDIPAAATMPAPKARPQSTAETVSCIVTAVLFGTFIAMCVANSQRRTLLFLT